MGYFSEKLMKIIYMQYFKPILNKFVNLKKISEFLQENYVF